MKTRVETFSSGRKLSTTLAGAFFLFSAVVLLLYTGLMGLYDYRTLEALISSRQQLIARDAAKAVSGFIHDNFSVLETAIWLTDFDTQREVERRRILQSLLGLRPAIRRLVLLDPHDQVLARASRLSMQASGQFTDRRLEELLSGQDRKAKRRMSTVTIDPVTGEPLVWLAVPVTDAFEDVRGTLIAELNLKSMWDIVDQLRVGETGYVYVADREGNLLAFQDTSRVLKGGRVSHIRVVADFIRNKPAVQPVAVERFQGIKGSTVVGTYAPLTMPDWAVVTELPWEEAYRVMARNLAAAVAFTLGIAILAGIFGVRVARRMAKPVIQLTETASRIAAGEPDLKAEVGGPREVACLAVAFNSMTSQLRQSLVDLEDRFGELKRTEEALRLSEQRLRLALEATSDGIWDWNLETGRVYFSPRYYTMMGYEPDEFPASYENWKRWVHPVDLEAAEKLVWQAIQDRTSYTIEFRFRAKDGDWRWILARGKVVETDEAGKAVRVSGTHSDITPRKRVEEALEKRILALTQPLGSVENIALEDILNLSDLQHLSDLFAKAFGVASLITRPDGTPITQPSNFTSFCSEIVRKTPRGLEKCNHSDAIIGRHNPSGPNIQPCLSAGLCNAGASITLGGSHVANWLIGQVRNEGVDEEKIMEYGREIGADEGVFRAAYLEVPVMSQEQFDNTAHVLFAVANQISNSAYQNILQARFISERKQAEESLRKYERIVSSSQDVMALINTDYVYETVNESLLKLQGRSREEIVGRTVSKVMGEKTFRHKLKARLDQALSGQTVHFQESFDYGETGRRVMDVNYFPIFDQQGRVEGVVLNARDITETRKLEEQLMQSQRIESLGTLAGGVAHEINNPINGIMNYAQLILDGMGTESPAKEYAEEIVHETRRIASIVRNLLTFARHEKQSHSLALLSDIVASVFSLIRTVLRHDQIDLCVDLPDDLPKIKCRSQQIQQVLMNLMTNARDALNERYPGYSPEKKIRVSAQIVQKGERRFIRTTVEDTGIGIPPEIRDRIFDPFFTTKPKEIGTGLGLSISYGIVKDHGGELSLEAEPGRYTRFHVDLPVENGWTLGGA